MQALIQEVLGGPQPDSVTLQALTKDPYANYVVQKMLEVSDLALSAPNSRWCYSKGLPHLCH